ncbi:hypothetical protein CWC38_04330 [Kocuria tytonicola]|nr:hypothetical protein CWC38_04330 [Kocuria tytonicola]
MSVRIAQMKNTGHGFSLLAEQEVPVSREQFDELVGRPEAMGRWFGVTFHWPTCLETPLEVGAALEFTPSGGVLPCEFIMIVADRVPGESLLLRTTKGTVDVTAEFTWRSVDGGVLVRLRNEVRMRGALWWRCPLTRALVRRAVTRGLECMREDVLGRAGTAAARETRLGARHEVTHRPGGSPRTQPVASCTGVPRLRRPQSA